MARKRKAAKAKKPRIPKPGVWHERPGAGSAGAGASPLGTAAQRSSSIPSSAPSSASSSGGGLMALLGSAGGTAAGAGSVSGLGGLILDLAGEGRLSLHTALAGWQRESERVGNRAWRRPGGFARMGGL